MIVWSRDDTFGSRGVIGRRFDNTYSPIDEDELIIDSHVNARYPDVAELDNGNIVVAYT